jgi:hypothetical protein
VFDKQNADDVNGKWQLHAPTNQINNGNQTVRKDEKFAELFPGLMKRIADAIQANADELKKNSTEIVSGGYDAAKAVSDLKNKFPMSYNSGEEEKKDEPQEDPGTFIVTLRSTGKQARIQATDEQDALRQIVARHPNIDQTDLGIRREE